MHITLPKKQKHQKRLLMNGEGNFSREKEILTTKQNPQEDWF